MNTEENKKVTLNFKDALFYTIWGEEVLIQDYHNISENKENNTSLEIILK